MVTTPNLGLTKPVVGDDEDIWGDMLNANSDLLDSQVAKINSQAFTGTPSLPTGTIAVTQTAGDASTKIATTAFVAASNTAQNLGTMATQNANAVAIVGGSINSTSVGATTPAPGAFTTLSASGVVSGAGFTTLLAPYAKIDSQAFTGTPSLPTGTTGITQAAADSTTKLATTAFVKSQNYLTGNQTITLSGDVTGSGSSAITGTVVQLQGRPLAATLPTTGQVISWNGTTWLPSTNTPTPAGSTGQIQYNNSGVMGGISQNGTGTVVMTTNSAAVVHQNTLGVTGAAATDVALTLNKPASGKSNFIYGQKAASTRWAMQLGDGAAESSGNVGSNFAIDRYNDAGTYLDSPLKITRSTGAVTISQTGAGTTNINGAAGVWPQLILNKAASGVGNVLAGSTNGLSRWQLALGDQTAESANAGGDFSVSRFNDAGTFLGSPLVIKRSDGAATFAGGLITQSAAAVAPASGTAAMYLTKPTGVAGNACQISGQTGANNRWIMSLGDGGVESGGNVGTNFVLSTFADAGAFLANPLVINRASGVATFASPIVNGSDAELKENVSSIPDALAKVLALNGVTYNQLGSDHKDIGLIAQEVQEVVPEVVFTVPSPLDPDKEILGIAYSQLVGLLVNAIKELNGKVAALEAKP